MTESPQDLHAAEEQIRDLMGSGDAQLALQYVRKLLSSYENRIAAIDRELESLKLHRTATEDTLRALRVVVTLTEGKLDDTASRRPYADGSITVWQCAKDVLERMNRRMPTEELADHIQRGGRDLGTQPAALVSGSITPHLGSIFTRVRDGRRYLYGLKRWGDTNDSDVKAED